MLETIQTVDKDGKPNGWLLPIWNANEDDYRPDQVYLTVVSPLMSKGPHLHMQRTGRFTCLKGEVLILMRLEGGLYWAYRLSGSTCAEPNQSITVPAGTPAAIYNVGADDAYVLNLVTPAWSKENPDDWPVEDWMEPAKVREL